MAKKPRRLEADVVVAGAGPGGCTVAKELSKTGKRVLLVERGGYSRRLWGTPIAALRSMEKKGKYFTMEGDTLIQGVGVGGGTLLYAGSAFEPDLEMWAKYGVDIAEETKEAKKDCWVQKPPDELISPGGRRLWAAAQELGYPWEKVDKFVDPAKCEVGCMKCVVGCPRGAKWTAMEFADEAVRNGATLLTQVTVRDVIVEHGTAGGVRALGSDGQAYQINAKVVVCSAGGMGTARILKRSGVHDAGSWFNGDPSIITTGYVKEGTGQKGDLLLTIGWHDFENGVLFGNVFMTRLAVFAQTFSREKRAALTNMFHYGKGMGILAKITDEMEGQVFLEEGKVSKPMTKRDVRRLEYGRMVNEKILIKAGCDAYNLRHTGIILGHPGGTVRVGTLLDSNLETSIKNLYCCDTSVVPESLGIPPTLTIVALGKRLSKRLVTILSPGKPRDVAKAIETEQVRE